MLCGSGTTGDHGWAESNPNAAEAEGLHVRPWQNPAEIRVLYRGHMAFLTEDGGVEYEDESEVEGRDVQRPGETPALPAQKETG